MIVCEYMFEKPDPDNPDYSLTEFDCYGHLPADKLRLFENHRLSIRKNLKTGKFELYRFYHFSQREEVIFSGEFKDVLNRAYTETSMIWGSEEKYIECEHTPPYKSSFCPMFWNSVPFKEIKKIAEGDTTIIKRLPRRFYIRSREWYVKNGTLDKIANKLKEHGFILKQVKTPTRYDHLVEYHFEKVEGVG